MTGVRKHLIRLNCCLLLFSLHQTKIFILLFAAYSIFFIYDTHKAHVSKVSLIQTARRISLPA